MESSELLALSTEAGWNQTEGDWAVFLRHGQVFVHRDGGRVVASAAALPYGPFGFVAMVLTTPSHRGRGLAARLTRQAIDALRPAVPVLDATPAGEPVYARLGFRPLFQIQRLVSPDPGTLLLPPSPCGRDRGRGSADGSLIPRDCLAGGPLPQRAGEGVADQDAFGADRAFLLADFARRPGTTRLVRAGRVAQHIGPLVRQSEFHAIATLESTRITGHSLIDVPIRWTRLTAWLLGRGFTVQRRFTRMARGRDTPFGEPARVFATAGPEFG